MEVNNRLRRFLDDHNRVCVWPSKHKDKLLVLEYLAAHMTPHRDYSEQEINVLLDNMHSFNDYALLRRALYDYAFLDRERNGSRYWLIPPEEKTW